MLTNAECVLNLKKHSSTIFVFYGRKKVIHVWKKKKNIRMCNLKNKGSNSNGFYIILFFYKDSIRTIFGSTKNLSVFIS